MKVAKALWNQLPSLSNPSPMVTCKGARFSQRSSGPCPGPAPGSSHSPQSSGQTAQFLQRRHSHTPNWNQILTLRTLYIELNNKEELWRKNLRHLGLFQSYSRSWPGSLQS